jgi:trimethylamine---corrinoid protein Co-methyltransferase
VKPEGTSPTAPHILTDAQIATVHVASVKTLAEVGILIEHEKARTLLAQAGATVEPGSHLVRIPESLVERALKTAPAEFTLQGQDETRDIQVGHDTSPRGRPVISLDWIVDYGARQRRQVTVRDLENWVRVADALPNLSLVSGLYAWDAAPNSRDVRAAQAMLEFSSKPMLIAPFSGWSVRWIARMLEALPQPRGPRAVVFSSCNSPLIYSEGQMDALVAAVECGLPVMVNSSAVTGATAPVTLAGSLVVMNAEILAGIVVTQLVRPGASVIYAGHPILLDMRTSIASCGCTEAGLLAPALVELGRSYGLPSASNGLTTDAHLCDEQAAIEKLITGHLALMSGAALNGGAGSLSSVGAVSLEQLVIDDDIYGRIFRIHEGIRMDEDTLAEEVIASVGPNRHYLEESHTLKYMRREFRQSELANRQSAEVWIQNGSRNVVDLASDRVRKILSKPPEPRFSPEVTANLEAIAEKAEQEAASRQV